MRKFKGYGRVEGGKSSRLVVIAAEGRYTENIYFETIKNSQCAVNVHVEILKRDDNSSNPENVEQQLETFAKEFDLDKKDQLWLVIDKDKWLDKTLSEIATRCEQKEYMHFCLSNPCFELWLLLHKIDVSQISDLEKQKLLDNKRVSKSGDPLLKKRLRELMGAYSEASYDAESLMPFVQDAI
ncbi:MAG: RloB family protein, partial [archaeon]|nr:RloB family protein [archaeon]